MKTAHRIKVVKFFMVVFMLLGAISIWAAADTIWYGWSSENWPRVEGVITSTEIDSSTQQGNSSFSSTAKSTTTYFPTILYRYEVNGGIYEGYEITFGGYSFINRDDAEEVLVRYPVNQRVDVYYKPDKPQKSVLEPGLTEFPYGFLFGGMLFVVFGFLVIRFLPKP